MEHSQELAARIRARLRELHADIAAHERALAELERSPAPAGTAGDRTPASAGAKLRSRRPPAALVEGDDDAALIAQEFGVSASFVRRRLAQLEQAARSGGSGEPPTARSGRRPSRTAAGG